MIQVLTTTPTGRRVVLAEADTFAIAKDFVTSLGVCFMEDDSDFADCADAYLNDGRTVAIQPEGFKLADAKRGARAAKFAQDRRDALLALDAEFGSSLGLGMV